MNARTQLILAVLIFGVTNGSFGQNPIMAWHLDQTSGLQTTESVTNSSFTVRNDYPKMAAEWAIGVSGNALRFNGFATWVEGNLTNPMPGQHLTISAWVAPEVYPVNTAAIFTNANLSGGGAYLAIDKYGRLETGVTVNGLVTKKTSTQKIPIYQWSRIALTVNSANGQMFGYINGDLVLQQSINSGTLNWASPNAVKIGKFHTQSLSGIYETGLFCGLIDEVKVYDQVLSQNDLSLLYANELPANVPDMTIPPSRFEGDIHRPLFHAMPQANWMNEPHGLIFYNGLYHIFYQKNGNGPYWGQLNWGHQTSADLVVWKEQKVVLWPDPDGYDKAGCWSGVSFEDNGKPYIMYTGVDGATAQMCLAEGNATASDYQKFLNNPVVPNPPAPYTSNDFRDPFIWKENGSFYMIIGTGNSIGGAALLYKSTDHINWTYLYTLKKGVQATDNTGVFWEVPMFLNFGNKRVFTAQPIPYNGLPARILYWTGTFENEYFTPDQTQPKQLEPGDALLGVTTTTDTLGRTIAIGIIPDILPDFEQRKNGWAHVMSLPRVWSLSPDGLTLLQKPLPALEKLRGTNHHFDNLAVSDGQTELLPGTEGRHLEFETTISPGNASKAGIILAKSADNSERTRIYWDIVAGIVVIDRNNSSVNNNLPKSFLTAVLSQPAGVPLKLRVFLDGSVLEVFMNDEKALSTRIYPEKPESNQIDLFTQGGMATFESVDIWEMKSMNDPTILATRAPVAHSRKIIASIQPNPTNGAFQLDFELPKPAEVSILVLDVHGKLFESKMLGQRPAGQNQCSLDSETLPAGTYIIQLLTDRIPADSTILIKQ